jgi:hypothetical protein
MGIGRQAVVGERNGEEGEGLAKVWFGEVCTVPASWRKRRKRRAESERKSAKDCDRREDLGSFWPVWRQRGRNILGERGRGGAVCMLDWFSRL